MPSCLRSAELILMLQFPPARTGLMEESGQRRDPSAQEQVPSGVSQLQNWRHSPPGSHSSTRSLPGATQADGEGMMQGQAGDRTVSVVGIGQHLLRWLGSSGSPPFWVHWASLQQEAEGRHSGPQEPPRTEGRALERKRRRLSVSVFILRL